MPPEGVADIRVRGLTKHYGNVVALFVVLVSIIPVYVAQRLAGATGLPTDRPLRGATAAAVGTKE